MALAPRRGGYNERGLPGFGYEGLSRPSRRGIDNTMRFVGRRDGFPMNSMLNWLGNPFTNRRRGGRPRRFWDDDYFDFDDSDGPHLW